MFDAEFWVAVAFVLFFVLFGKKLWQALTGRLDERAERIRAELDQAVRLREEAQELLASYQRRQREAVAEAEDILAHARAEAERMTEEAKERIARQLARREQLAKDKIAQAEARALDDIRTRVVDIVIAATAQVIADGLDEARATALVDDAISGLERHLKS